MCRHLIETGRVIRIVGALFCTLSWMSLSGCGNAAANTAIGLLAGGAVAGAATHSSVQVQVEVYDPRTDSDSQDIELPQMLVIQRTILQTAATRLLDIEADAAPHVAEIEAQTPILRKLAAEDIADVGPSVRKGGEQFASLADREIPVHDTWDRFRTACAQLATSTTGSRVQAAGQSLRAFRAALIQLAGAPAGDEAITEIKFRLLGEIFVATVHDDATQKAYDAHVANVGSAGTDASMGIAARLQSVFDAVAKEFSNAGPAVTAVISKNQKLFLAPFKAAESVQDEAQTTIEITENAITTSVNLGPINNEVTQTVLTPGRILGRITDPENKRHWRSFSPNSVFSGPGNSDVVFYMENQGTPVLKSANFDPTKFIVAAGAVYERAFSILADASVAGAPGSSSSNTSGGDAKTSGGKKKKAAAGSSDGTSGDGSGNVKTPSGQGNSGVDTPTANPKAIKVVQKEINAIKSAEIAGLRDILKVESNIKSAASDAKKLKEAANKAKVTLTRDSEKIKKLSEP